ncbi:PhnB protein [Marinococcus luteus]|uniref:PhnB protein n=1 Tax=Marinococcus luteus TaxID=1122204 RepID=A0A1H2WCH6_9BACI|nr:VOC family protein [Marinococcus luteus]SDW78237.1 PhnB protein [Marinococcus luteus]
MITGMTPYLTFTGKAREAAVFYEKALGARVIESQTYAEVEGMEIPPGAEELIMHAYLKIGDTELMLSDTFSESSDLEAPGSLVSIALSMSDASSAAETFHALEAGGEVIMPMAETFFSPAYGQLKDQFGVLWHVVAYEKEK